MILDSDHSGFSRVNDHGSFGPKRFISTVNDHEMHLIMETQRHGLTGTPIMELVDHGVMLLMIMELKR